MEGLPDELVGAFVFMVMCDSDDKLSVEQKVEMMHTMTVMYVKALPDTKPHELISSIAAIRTHPKTLAYLKRLRE